MAYSIGNVLNSLSDLGLFAYILPFLIIFALVFAILQKSGILGDNKSIQAIIAMAVGLISLQFNFVPSFFAIIFPRFGVVLAMFLVFIILAGIFYDRANTEGNKKFTTIGIILAVAAIIWALASWNNFGFGNYEIGYWFQNNFWTIIILALVGGGIYLIVKGGSSTSGAPVH